MYQVTVIENEDELLKALSKNRSPASDYPSLKEITFVIDDETFQLELEDDKFDISLVDSVALLTKVLKDRGIKLQIITSR